MGLDEMITAPVIEYIEARNTAMEKAIKFAEEEKKEMTKNDIKCFDIR